MAPLKLLIASLLLLAAIAVPARGEFVVTLRSGYRIVGNAQNITGLDQTAVIAAAQGSDLTTYPVLVVDDGLKRVFVHNRGMVAQVGETEDLLRRIPFRQSVARSTKEIAAVGFQTTATPFNADGRRVVTTLTPGGPIEILQGITEVNSRYVQAQSLQTKNPYNWDSRISLNAVPGEVLNLFFQKQFDPQDLDNRLDVLKLYIDSERFPEARRALQELIRDFPDKPEFQAELQELTQREVRGILSEARTRRSGGQYAFSLGMLQHLIQVPGIARTLRLEAEDLIQESRQQGVKAEGLLQQLRQQIAQLAPAQAARLSAFVDTIQSEMTPDTILRLSDYERLGNEAAIPLENRIALAIGGWLQGGGSGVQNLAIATSLIEVRRLVSTYLADENPVQRSDLLRQLAELEGARPDMLAKLLPLIPPPLPLPSPGADESAADPADEEENQKSAVPGFFELSVETTGGTVQYVVQLPPEYHPLRKYPTILALHPLGLSPDLEIDWWSGIYDPQLGLRAGQAHRRGYVVVAPKWDRPGQGRYEFTQLEHQRVLASLRDAMRRISIDTDRVFLAGHIDGATAAWDIALAHPDLWAGLICIGGAAEKYIQYYSDNAKYLPMYFVTGDMSATSSLQINGTELNRYMKPSFDAMVTLYRGRGDELFYEDINNIFNWMELSSHRRQKPPTEIGVVTMRQGDQFFWWLELVALQDNVIVHPILFDNVERKQRGQIEARINPANTIRITQVPGPGVRILLSPELGLDLANQVTIHLKGRSKTHSVGNSIEFMLEDVRQRADRQHVFWDAVTLP